MPNNKKKNRKKSRVGVQKGELENAAKWSQKDFHGLNAKTLAKKLPDTAAKIRNGTLDPKEIASDLSELSWEHARMDGHELFLEVSKTMPHPFVILTKSATRSFSKNDHDIYKFYEELRKTAESITETKDCPYHEKIQRIQRIFDLVGKRWEKRILLKTRRTLKETSPFYQVDANNYFEKFSKAWGAYLKYDDPKARKIYHAFHKKVGNAEIKCHLIDQAVDGVLAGEDRITKVCWECDGEEAKDFDRMRQCSRCKVAKYCSHQCQEKAWRAGHRHACQQLKSRYKGYKEDQQRIRQAVDDEQIVTTPIPVQEEQRSSSARAMMCYLKPAPSVDYLNAFACAEGPNLPKIPDGAKGPSLDIQYHNLAALACGGTHPIFRGTGPQYTKEFLGKIFEQDEPFQKFPKPTQGEVLASMQTLQVLCYDLSDVPDTKEMDVFVTTTQFIIMVISGSNLVPLPRLLEMYVLIAASEALGEAHRHQMDTSMFQLLKSKYHKC